ncbi:hypothetical protein GCM10009788_22100 [Nocardioides humi]|uniref:Uncharacterized protein n=1 Tax=Nocardioides humi TaxID=449461 RepID=A0ABN2AEF4_9ACTN
MSMATSAVLSITAPRIGPRSLRSPTLARVIGLAVETVTYRCNRRPAPGIPPGVAQGRSAPQPQAAWASATISGACSAHG